uniref:Zinc finger RNA binding protein 2 n=1 Tax=Homo sapiens TaxID=9606 RepID=A0A6I8PRF6_HUMAN
MNLPPDRPGLLSLSVRDSQPGVWET